MNTHLLTLVILSLSLTLLSCQQSEVSHTPASEIKLALMVKRSDIQWYKMQIKGFEDRCSQLGVHFFILDNKMDSNLTLANIDTLINRKVDGVAIAVTNQKMSSLVVNRIFEAGIPLLSLNYKLIDKQGRQLAPHIGIDYGASAKTAAGWLAKQIEKCSLIENPSSSPGIAQLTSPSVMEIIQWTKNIQKELLKRLPHIPENIFFTVNSPPNDAAGAMIAMQKLLAAHRDVTHWIIYAGSSDEMDGALRALDQIGMKQYSCALSIESKKDPEKESVPSSLKKAVLFVDTYAQGRQAADLLYRYVTSGIAIPPVSLTPYRIKP